MGSLSLLCFPQHPDAAFVLGSVLSLGFCSPLPLVPVVDSVSALSPLNSSLASVLHVSLYCLVWSQSSVVARRELTPSFQHRLLGSETAFSSVAFPVPAFPVPIRESHVSIHHAREGMTTQKSVVRMRMTHLLRGVVCFACEQ